MQRTREYQNRAEECRRLAKRAKSPGEREAVLKMAAHWEALANSRSEHVEQKERLARLDGNSRNQIGMEG
jgi:hypothetical protein